MSVHRDKIDAFRAEFSAACVAFRAEHGHRLSGGAIEIDTEFTVADLEGPLGATLSNSLDMLEPTGQECAEAQVVLHDARIESIRVVGEVHLRARVRLGPQSVTLFIRDGIERVSREELALVEGKRYSIVGRIRADSYGGPTAVQLDVSDTRSG